MKLKIKLLLASMVAIGAMNPGLRADYVAVSTQPVTYTLTTKTAGPGTFAVGEDGKLTKTPAFESVVDTLDKNGNPIKSVSTFATKAITGKYGNKEILESIKDDLLDGSISGWSIQWVNEGDGGLFAVKNGQDPVDLKEVANLDLPEVVFGSSVQTTTNKYSGEELTSSTTTAASSGSLEGRIEFSVLGGDVDGSFVQPYKGMTYYPDPADKSVQEIVDIPGAAKITGVIGEATITDINENESQVIIAGTASLAAAKGTLVKE